MDNRLRHTHTHINKGMTVHTYVLLRRHVWLNFLAYIKSEAAKQSSFETLCIGYRISFLTGNSKPCQSYAKQIHTLPITPYPLPLYPYHLSTGIKAVVVVLIVALLVLSGGHAALLI